MFITWRPECKIKYDKTGQLLHWIINTSLSAILRSVLTLFYFISFTAHTDHQSKQSWYCCLCEKMPYSQWDSTSYLTKHLRSSTNYQNVKFSQQKSNDKGILNQKPHRWSKEQWDWSGSVAERIEHIALTSTINILRRFPSMLILATN